MPALSALVATVLGSFRRRAALQVEILALRHQLGVLQRSVKRPKLSTTDRILWVWLSSVWNEWRTSVFIVKAATVVEKRYGPAPKGDCPRSETDCACVESAKCYSGSSL